MTIKQLQEVQFLNYKQHVTIHDSKNHRTIRSEFGWVLEPEYDYPGTNVDEIERILKLRIDSMSWDNNVLTIHAH